MVADRPGIEALRETVGRLFERFTLYELRDAPDDDARPFAVDQCAGRAVADGRRRYVLKPTVRPEAIARHAGFAPVPERVALSYATGDSIATRSLSVVRAHVETLAAAVVGPIPVGA